jgi:hypothetical protein
MAGRTISDVRKASAREVRELSKLPWVRDDALSEFGEARVLPDGRVLYMDAVSRGNLYPSREAVAEWNRQLLETERQSAEQWAAGLPDPCLTLLPPIDDFLRDVDAHAKSLGKTIKVADEVLDRSVESLNAVDAAMKRIPWAKRPVREILTPLTAYVGEVMLRGSGGHWAKRPATEWKQAWIYDPAELAAYFAVRRKMQPIAVAAADKVAAEARARGASQPEVDRAWSMARRAAFDQLTEPPHRVELREDNEPLVIGRGREGHPYQPFAVVYLPMVDPSRRIPLRDAVDVYLRHYRGGGTVGSTR